VPPASRTPDVKLGRLTEATQDYWAQISASVPKAPRLMRGEVPRKSPDLIRFDPGYPPDWPDASTYYQTRGFCVGHGTAHIGEAEDATPDKITPRSKPARPRKVSQLYSYAGSRWMATQRGMNLGSGDGAIVSHSVEFAAVHGWLPYDEWPNADGAEDRHRNGTFPTAAQKAKGKEHAPGGFASLDSWDAILETLGAGRYVVVGTDWLQGMTRTDSDGAFSASGGSVGGHCYLIVDYDLDRDLVWIKNSHPQYGMRSTAAKYKASGGYTNIGVGKLSGYKKLFSPSYMSGGRSEALVLWGSLGFVPKIVVP
jgi:hypothetical protein